MAGIGVEFCVVVEPVVDPEPGVAPPAVVPPVDVVGVLAPPEGVVVVVVPFELGGAEATAIVTARLADPDEPLQLSVIVMLL